MRISLLYEILIVLDEEFEISVSLRLRWTALRISSFSRSRLARPCETITFCRGTSSRPRANSVCPGSIGVVCGCRMQPGWWRQAPSQRRVRPDATLSHFDHGGYLHSGYNGGPSRRWRRWSKPARPSRLQQRVQPVFPIPAFCSAGFRPLYRATEHQRFPRQQNHNWLARETSG